MAALMPSAGELSENQLRSAFRSLSAFAVRMRAVVSNQRKNIMNRRTLTTLALLGFAVAALPQAGFAQTNMGNWKLNLAKSTYNPGPAPRSSTFNFQVEGQN